MSQIVFKLNSKHHWEGVKADGTSVSFAGKAGDIYNMLKTAWPGVQIGFQASDFGPAIAKQCAAQGYGNILWMK